MSEKKLHMLTIDPEFRDLIPPLNDDELTMLEESIVANGCESPLIVWNGVIVDGHNRHAICQKHNIPFAVTEKEFSSREDAMLWMLRNQLGRRNLNSYQRSDLVLKLEPLMASEAKLRKGQRTDLGQNSAPGSQMGKTSHKLAEMAGVSHDTIKKVKKLNEAADEETKSKLRRGEVTVHKAYTELMQKEHENETRVCDRCKQEKPVAAFSIPSNRHGFSSLCKDCEKEISAAAKAAAEVASATTAKVETHGHAQRRADSCGDASSRRAGHASPCDEHAGNGGAFLPCNGRNLASTDDQRHCYPGEPPHLRRSPALHRRSGP